MSFEDWNGFQETGHVQRWLREGPPHAIIVNNDQYILLIARRDTTANAAKVQRLLSFFWQQDEVFLVKQSEISFMRVAYEILKLHVVPYTTAIDDFFLKMLDNARHYTASLVQNFLTPIQHMEWLAYFSDLNSTRCVWDTLGRRVAARPRSLVTWIIGKSDFGKRVLQYSPKSHQQPHRIHAK
ncbi:hypothetical protein TNCV_657071 [Trichonephila clavipes]|nr:hypothetical protein TNCV_657071 [Trichonephila clavipes]